MASFRESWWLLGRPFGPVLWSKSRLPIFGQLVANCWKVSRDSVLPKGRWSGTWLGAFEAGRKVNPRPGDCVGYVVLRGLGSNAERLGFEKTLNALKTAEGSQRELRSGIGAESGESGGVSRKFEME